MMQQQIVGMAEVDELAVVARQRLQAVVRGLDENIRMVARRAQHALNAENLVADRIAIAQSREHLMDADHDRDHPAGSFATTSCAAGRSWRRRSSHPGVESLARGGASFDSRANMSRYFRSMTRQS